MFQHPLCCATRPSWLRAKISRGSQGEQAHPAHLRGAPAARRRGVFPRRWVPLRFDRHYRARKVDGPSPPSSSSTGGHGCTATRARRRGTACTSPAEGIATVLDLLSPRARPPLPGPARRRAVGFPLGAGARRRMHRSHRLVLMGLSAARISRCSRISVRDLGRSRPSCRPSSRDVSEDVLGVIAHYGPSTCRAPARRAGRGSRGRAARRARDDPDVGPPRVPVQHAAAATVACILHPRHRRPGRVVARVAAHHDALVAAGPSRSCFCSTARRTRSRSSGAARRTGARTRHGCVPRTPPPAAPAEAVPSMLGPRGGGFAKTAALFARATRDPGGIYGHQSPRMLVAGAYPSFFARGEGAACGTSTATIHRSLCSYGPIVLGHNHPVVDAAAAAQAANGHCFNGPRRAFVELAERLVALTPWAAWAVFAKNGSDVCTGRRRSRAPPPARRRSWPRRAAYQHLPPAGGGACDLRRPRAHVGAVLRERAPVRPRGGGRRAARRARPTPRPGPLKQLPLIRLPRARPLRRPSGDRCPTRIGHRSTSTSTSTLHQHPRRVGAPHRAQRRRIGAGDEASPVLVSVDRTGHDAPSARAKEALSLFGKLTPGAWRKRDRFV